MINETTSLEIINKFLKKFNTTIDSIGPYTHYMTYTIDNFVVGLLGYDLIYDRLEIEYIYVDEEYRNKKIASKMLMNLIGIGSNNNCINISLEVRESNIVAINFYKKHGFKEAARREKYYGSEDGILMIRELV